METLHWGIIGCGRISTTFCRALNGLDGVEITGVAAREARRAEAFAEKVNSRHWYGSYEELVKDPAIDVVYVGIPHSEHKRAAMLAMDAGKHVLCEKPFALNAAEAKEMAACARKNGVFLMEAFWSKFLPVTLKMKEWIETGRLGKVQYVKTDFCYRETKEGKPRLYDPALGGGALLDVGIYDMGITNFLLGEHPDKIESMASMGPTGVDELDSITCHYPSGILADMNCSIVMVKKEEITIQGTQGSICSTPFWGAEEATLYGTQGEIVDQVKLPHPVNGYEYEILEVKECIAQGKKECPGHTLEETISTLKLLDQIRAQWNFQYPQEKNLSL